MRSKRRACTMLLAAVALAIAAPAAQASFGVTENNFEAGTCSGLTPSCTYKSPANAFFTQAAGHPPWGITTFELNHSGEAPEGALKRIRVDVPAGLAANPQAVPQQCKRTEFEENKCSTETKVGTIELVAYDGITDITVTGNVYDLEQPEGLPLLFGIDTGVEPIADVHIYLEGHVDWSGAHPGGAYHEYFEINNVPREAELSLSKLKVPLTVLKSKLNFDGRAGAGNFLTLPSVCSPTTTSYLEVESYEGEVSKTETHTPAGVEGCSEVPFKPIASVFPETSTSDQPDGATTVVRVPQHAGENEINTADIKDAHVTLPEGLTLNPSAAHGLEACSPAQIGIGTLNPVTCPAGSAIGTVTIETDLPAKSLSGKAYLGNPAGGAITGPPYTIYLDAESQYDVSVRLKGSVVPNPSTGRLEVTFLENPPLPFSQLILNVNGGARSPLANPLACGSAQVEALFTPYTGTPAALSGTPFVTTGCPSPVPFSLGQSTQNTSPKGGSYTSYTFNLRRADGQQYLSQLRTVLPAGLVGAIPSVPLCKEPLAQQGACPASSQIGTATATAGAGAEPYAFSGPVFLTSRYGSSPYGLSIPIAAVAGPFNLGTVVTRVGISVDPSTARVIVTSNLPTIVGGVPLRLKSLSVAINRSKFLFNPTNCSPLATDSVLTSTLGATNPVSSPFQVSSCSSLAFKPSFKATTSNKTSKRNGAGLVVTLVQGAHQANIRSVVASLPIQLPSRLSTLQKACVGATFDANPAACPPESKVGTATVSTPVLPSRLTGPAYLVSRGGAAFPDLDLILEGSGVRIVVVGNTDIKHGITTSTFASIPDVPVSGLLLELPVGPYSVLSAYGNLCLHPLLMPTTITAQSGAVIKQNTRIGVYGCGVRILSRRVRGHRLILKVRTLGGGLITVKGKGFRTTHRRVRKSSTVTFKLALTRGGLRSLSRHHPLKVAVHVDFKPSARGALESATSTTVKFRR
ncbi:MAG TPA: hypothetical protein VNR42_09475 [Solirubrobacteraceae bacterium]|nr:hypothetical protein [Solirubrobacteraceae bacterium]